MALTSYKRFSLRNRIFWGFLIICLLSIVGTSTLSFFILKNNSIEQSRTDMQSKTEALMASLDYAVSHTQVETRDLPEVLGNKIYEIADINKHDVIIYDLKGNFLLSNKDLNLIPNKKIPLSIVNKVLKSKERVDIQSFDTKTQTNLTSSYLLMANNTLDPVAIVYFSYYHNESAYFDVLNKYIKYIFFVNILIIIFSIWLSWIISNNLTKALTRFSELITRITLFENDFQPIKYYKNDELSALVKAYNKMILQIQDQKERLSFKEKESAWREMAKQVAHEVKNPLTPMKLTIQNFERKFDPNDPKITEKVKKMSAVMVDQIDLIATVASAFSQFAQLPEKNNETFNLNKEISNVLGVFSDDKIFVHANKENIMINMDKIYLNRILTNLITNAKQAESSNRASVINVDLEQYNKRVMISVEDNGIGIPEEKYDRIFEPNFTSKNSGMGLGLTMVRKMIEDYKGEITVKSELGKGTIFTISLPTNLR